MVGDDEVVFSTYGGSGFVGILPFCSVLPFCHIPPFPGFYVHITHSFVNHLGFSWLGRVSPSHFSSRTLNVRNFFNFFDDVPTTINLLTKFVLIGEGIITSQVLLGAEGWCCSIHKSTNDDSRLASRIKSRRKGRKKPLKRNYLCIQTWSKQDLIW